MNAAEPRSTFERVLARRSEALLQAQTERAEELARQGAGRSTRPRRITLARVALLGLGLLFVRLVFCGTPTRRGNEPLGAVATADGAGVGSSATAFLPSAAAPRATTGPATPEPEPAPAVSRGTSQSTPARPSVRPPAKTPAPHDVPGAARVLLTADSTPEPDTFATAVGADAATTSRAAQRKAVINIGTRLRATLDMPLRTGSALAPATATLAEDLRRGEHVLVPAGTRLVGSAFAMPHDDRVQIVWRALVHDGLTTAIQAETLGADGAPGIAGKVVRRHGKGVFRRVGGALAGTAGDLAGVAIPLGDTLAEQAGATFAGRAGRELGQLGRGREWLQSNAVVELKAGAPLVVSVSTDVTLSDSGER